MLSYVEYMEGMNMETEKIMFNGKEVEIVVSINKEFIERNEDKFLNDTIILNNSIKNDENNGIVGEKYE